ncbi:MAG TPA: T9SS type A sorting domain-containing protein, partial [Tenuifilaceae bacterium]|nr:T9SS type A sorting domain-containing protein [Tenuifilaceae bacterium]
LGYENNIILETDVLENEVTLGVMAYRMGVDCDPVYSTYDQNIAVMIYNLTIEVSGNVLMSSILPYDYYENPFGAIAYQWYRNNVAIQNNGDGQSITIYDEAEYSVKVTTREDDGGIGCILTASTAKDGEEPIVDVPSTLAVSLYPNPVQKGELNVTLAGEYIGQMQVRVINLAGVILYETIINKNEVSVNEKVPVESLTQGVYILQITGGEYSEVQRFIKK